MLANKLMSTLSGETEDKLYVDDVFSTYLYTGKNSAQAINNGIDLAGEGGMVWFKQRNGAGVHFLYDSVRGTNYALHLNANPQSFNSTYKPTFTSNGYTDNLGWATSQDLVSWTLRKAPKFFDIQVFNNTASMMPHNLGAVPGMVIMKALDYAQDWFVWHRGSDGNNNIRSLKLNTASQGGVADCTEGFTATHFSPMFASTGQATDSVGYVAYLFAHDSSADGIIQCGSYIGNGYATGPIVNLGWEPQYLMIKNASGTGNWQIIDSMRGMPVGSADATLQANLSNAESSVDFVSPTATGFQVTSSSSEVNTNNSTYVYMAIRRSNKPPTTGTQVYNAIARTGSGAAAMVTGVGFAPDAALIQKRTYLYVRTNCLFDKLRGVGKYLSTNLAGMEDNYPNTLTAFTNTGISLGNDASDNVNSSADTYINHFFKRAPGFFDVVCYTGTSVARTVPHELGVAPELMIVKHRSSAPGGNNRGWMVYAATLGNTQTIVLSLTNSASTQSIWNNTTPTYLGFSLGAGPQENFNGATYVAYLFASLPGISKVGNYTGNDSSQTIDCGFTTGARFILIKRTDSTGDWYVWDTARGIVAANDPHLSLNTSATEVTTDDSVDPHASGFIVNQNAATNINVSGGQYIFLAIA